MADRFVATVEVIPRSQLVTDTLVLDKPIFARRPDRLLVQPHGIKVPAFDAGKLSRHQCVFVGKRRWVVIDPLTELFSVRLQEFAPPVLLVSTSVLVERRYRQRGVVKVVDY